MNNFNPPTPPLLILPYQFFAFKKQKFKIYFYSMSDTQLYSDEAKGNWRAEPSLHNKDGGRGESCSIKELGKVDIV
jgi:hypothetical protein